MAGTHSFERLLFQMEYCGSKTNATADVETNFCKVKRCMARPNARGIQDDIETWGR